MQQLELWDLLSQVENSSQEIKPLLFPNPRKAEKLRELADSMTKAICASQQRFAIAAKKNSPIAQLNPTRRRARIADSLYQEGLRLEQIQFLLYALANSAELGNLPRIKRRNHRQNPTGSPSIHEQGQLERQGYRRRIRLRRLV
ncbi:hypothetical protein OGM63_19050 [Plectonema radiosum NIES-515]|uniref:Uncharacterized protein n=1 Tax=Plectonema radiosum NIES-515 TaxID=2986073 RepID=A0ABT3B2I8_9CYAN|nr:hypothetical protein [Plectonema radiosum]MCV3215583.1 hypothetical protein [Plectonema radiosum NIES-515]